MSKEGSVRNFIAGRQAFSVGSPFSLDSRNGEAARTMYYDFDGKKPMEEIVFGESKALLSDKDVISQADPIVFLMYGNFPLSLPGNRVEVEKLFSSEKDSPGNASIAHITPGLKKSQVEQINALDEQTKHALLQDLSNYYPRFSITQGIGFEGFLGEYGGLLDSPGYEQIIAVEGFAKPFRQEINDRAIWKIAKEYPQKNEYEKIVLSFGLNYSVPENNEDAMSKRSDEFIKAMELKGKDALDMLDQIARPSIEIRRQSLYDTDTIIDQ